MVLFTCQVVTSRRISEPSTAHRVMLGDVFFYSSRLRTPAIWDPENRVVFAGFKIASFEGTGYIGLMEEIVHHLG